MIKIDYAGNKITARTGIGFWFGSKDGNNYVRRKGNTQPQLGAAVRDFQRYYPGVKVTGAEIVPDSNYASASPPPTTTTTKHSNPTPIKTTSPVVKKSEDNNTMIYLGVAAIAIWSVTRKKSKRR